MKKKNRILQGMIIFGMAVCMSGCGAAKEAGTQDKENTGMSAEETGGTESGISGADGETGAAEEPETGEEKDDGEETGEEAGAGENGEAEGAAQTAAEGYYVMLNGVAVGADMDMDELAEQLGESLSVFEAPSCAGEGVSYIYTFPSCQIETYPAADGKNRISTIILKDDTIATAEGVDLSMTKEKVIEVYGEEYEETDNKITYENNGTKLNFIFDGETIISIEYVSAVLG